MKSALLINGSVIRVAAALWHCLSSAAATSEPGWDSLELMRLFDLVILFRRSIIPSLVSSWCGGRWSLPPESLVAGAGAQMSEMARTVIANWCECCVTCVQGA